MSVGARTLRWLLLTLAPLSVLTVAGYLYLTDGRYLVTENAYVQAQHLVVSPAVEGSIIEVMVAENQRVERGEPLFRIDPRPYRLALLRAEARLAAVAAEIESLRARHRQKQEELSLAQSEVEFRRREHQRQLTLAGHAVVSEAVLEAAAQELRRAEGHVAIVEREIEVLAAALAGDSGIAITAHPLYLSAAAERESAALDLERTLVEAPFAGIVGQIPEVGRHLQAGQAAMSLVAANQLWVEANFRETELTHLQIGMPARLEVDSYPGWIIESRVESISQATGSQFSVLPPQNASGNWVKVTQRVAIRISLPHGGGPVLRSGMSVHVEIDTGSYRRMPTFLAALLGIKDTEATDAEPSAVVAHQNP